MLRVPGCWLLPTAQAVAGTRPCWWLPCNRKVLSSTLVSAGCHPVHSVRMGSIRGWTVPAVCTSKQTVPNAVAQQLCVLCMHA